MQIKVLLMAVKDFDPNCGDSAYTMGIVDLLLECVELSYRHGKYGLRALNMLCPYEKMQRESRTFSSHIIFMDMQAKAVLIMATNLFQI